MRRKPVLLITLAILVAGMLSFTFRVQRVEASGTIYIRPDGSIDVVPWYPVPINHTGNTYTFTDNINDEIVVEKDSIVIDGAGYTLQGPGANGIDLSSRSAVTIKNLEIRAFSNGIYANSSHNNIISGNTITDNTRCGIWFRYSSNNIFYGNTITNTTHWTSPCGGVRLEISGYNNISRNTIANHRGFGIHLVACSNSNITGNNVTNSGNDIYGDDDGYGICLASCSNNTITGNNVTNNDYGIYIRYPSCANNTVSGNNVTNNGCGIRLDCSNNTLTGNDITNNVDGITLSSYAHYNDIFANNVTANTNWGIYLWDCEKNTLTGNNITNNEYGIYLQYCSNNTVSGNTITNNSDGIYLYSSAVYNDIFANNVTANTNTGIYIEASSENTLTGNTITNNEYGIRIEGSSYWNSIYHNNFIDNTQQVYIPPPGYANFWDDGYPSGGNYWSNYTGVDLYSGPSQIETGSDGIGDEAHDLFSNNQDKYPLMGMFSEFSVAYEEETYDVSCSSNSSISAFEYDLMDNLIRFNVAGPSGTGGFCRICIPHDLMEPPYIVIIDDGETEVLSYNEYSYEGVTYIYFTYQHSTHEVEIIPEFPTWTSMLLLLVLLTVAIAIYKRRPLKTPTH